MRAVHGTNNAVRSSPPARGQPRLCACNEAIDRATYRALPESVVVVPARSQLKLTAKSLTTEPDARQRRYNEVHNPLLPGSTRSPKKAGCGEQPITDGVQVIVTVRQPPC